MKENKYKKCKRIIPEGKKTKMFLCPKCFNEVASGDASVIGLAGIAAVTLLKSIKKIAIKKYKMTYLLDTKFF